MVDSLINVVSVVGPTASGKSALAVGLAKKFNGEIISADSMQIYKGMNIATAKPDLREMQGVAHHLIDFLPPDKSYSVAAFVRDAKKCVDEIISRQRLPIIAGGTGLYIDSFLNNISFGEEKRDEAVTASLWEQYRSKGIDSLLDMLSAFDLQTAQRLSIEKNPKRIIRAIEFYKTTGIPISRQNELSRREKSPYRGIKLGLNFTDRQRLYEKINARVDLMLEKGLLAEAYEFLSTPLGETAAKAIGYKELEPYFKGEATLDDCVERLKRETRRYAKRQITWFKKDSEINWLYADEYNSYEELFSHACSIVEKGLNNG